MKFKAAPQLFHDKDDKPKTFAIYSLELIEAMNNLCSGNELKVLLTLLACKGDGSFAPSTQYMVNKTGIQRANNFCSTRKNLVEKGYIQEKDGDMYVSTEKILEDYKVRSKPSVGEA